MDSTLLSSQGTLIGASEADSLAFLLERGIDCTRQASSVEGAAFFALARERLAPDQTHLALVLDTLIHSHVSYLQAQQALHMASRRFAEADIDQQTQLVTLEKLLSALREDMTELPQLHAAAQALENSQNHQPAQAPRTLVSDAQLEQPSVPPHSLPRANDTLPALYVTCFGCFEVWRSGRPIALCTSRSGQMILRYLVAQPRHSATIDTLIALLWPEDEQEVAQPKLHIAISALRRSLNEGYSCVPGYGYILCKNRVYRLNPAVAIRTDVDEFLQCYQAGQQASEEKTDLYERACHLYAGPFLTEDMYADWSFLQREQLSQAYLAMCRALAGHYFNNRRYEDATQWTTAILKENRCDESAHRQLIHIYAAQGRRSEALQQYQRCVQVLYEELGVQPLPETMHVFQALLANEPLPGQA